MRYVEFRSVDLPKQETSTVISILDIFLWVNRTDLRCRKRCVIACEEWSRWEAHCKDKREQEGRWEELPCRELLVGGRKREQKLSGQGKVGWIVEAEWGVQCVLCVFDAVSNTFC